MINKGVNVLFDHCISREILSGHFAFIFIIYKAELILGCSWQTYLSYSLVTSFGQSLLSHIRSHF